MSILISGSLAYDHIMDFHGSFKDHILPDQIHVLNVSFGVETLHRSWGGTAGNIAFAMRLLGGEPILFSAVGKDGREYLERLRELGVDISYLQTDSSKLTAAAHIMTDRDDNQITSFFPGPLARATAAHVEQLTTLPSLALISPNPKEVMLQHARECVERGVRVVFDPGQAVIAFTKEELQTVIRQAHIVIGNDYEMHLIEERTGWSQPEILKSVAAVITTLGAEGSSIRTKAGEEIRVRPCPPKSCDDPTGAGDAFRAGFFVAYERGQAWKTCAQMGSVSASYAIETYGTQEYTFTPAEFEQRYKATYEQPVSS